MISFPSFLNRKEVISLQITFYQFSKRTNSTKQPTGVTGTTLSCQLKEQTSMLTPILIIKATPAGWSPIWNYAYIPVFQRFYFIKNWNWLNGCWECDAVCDVMASFKTDIGNMSEYILRSSYAYTGSIIDTLYPTKTDVTTDVNRLTSIFKSVYVAGYYVLGVISNDQSAAQGAVTYYQMTPTQLANLKHFMMSDDFMNDLGFNQQTVLDYIPTEVLKTLYDPFKYIASCIWIPLDIDDYLPSLRSTETISFGWFKPTSAFTQYPITGYRLNANGYVKKYQSRIQVTDHPQKSNRGVFLDHMPFTERMLYYPPFGSIPINDDSIIGGDYIRIEIDVDMIMGDAVLSLFHDRLVGNDTYDNMGLIARVSAPVGIPIQLAQTSIDVAGTVSVAATNATTGILRPAFENKLTDNFITDLLLYGADAVMGAVNGISDAIHNPVGMLQSSGVNGSQAQYSIWPYFIQKHRIVADDDNAQKGRPLCEIRQISTIPGYIMVDTPDVQLSCLAAERDQIIAFMSGGFFYE